MALQFVLNNLTTKVILRYKVTQVTRTKTILKIQLIENKEVTFLIQLNR